MVAWYRSANSSDDGIGFYNALAAGVVISGLALSFGLAAPIDHLLTRSEPVGATFNLSVEFQAPPNAAVFSVAALPAAETPVAEQPALAETTPVETVERIPLPLARPAQTEHVAVPPPRPHTAPEGASAHASAEPENEARQSRRQVERNVRNQRSLRRAVDAAVAAGAAPAGIPTLISEARRYIGTNPTTRARLWCARFMNFVLRRSGFRGTGSDLAMSFARYGHRIPGPRVGAIAVMRRKGGGHVGIVTGVRGKGRIVLLSGNDGRRVRERVRSTRNVVAYVMPAR